MKYILYPNVFVVSGFTRYAIIDVHIKKVYFLPKSLGQLLKKHKLINIDALVRVFGEHNRTQIQELISFLIKNDLVYTDSIIMLKRISKIQLEFNNHSTIGNVLIDLTEKNLSKDYINRLNFLLNRSNTLISALQIRFFGNSSYKLIEYLEFLLQNLCVENIEIILSFHSKSSEEKIIKLCESYLNINRIIIYGSSFEKEILVHGGLSVISYLTLNIPSTKKCGNISHESFNNNLKFYAESQTYNTCLNCKISVDSDGNIKNCPSMKQNFGNIKDTTLEDALNKKGFKKLWNINKDKIKVCQDCEFRYICTDCRAYIEDPKDIYSKPLKCGYDPYTGEWSEWSTNPLKQKAIKYYGMEELVKKDE
jgi:SPASM domain peptide maturase of grasp-with-spasm system